MAEEQERNTQKSRRDQFNERLKAKYPDREFADDEALFGQIDDDYADYDNQLSQYRDREERLSRLMADNPRAAQFISDLGRGDDPWLAMLKRIGADGVTDLMNNPEKQEAYAQANQEYVDRLAEEKRLEEEYNANFAESMSTLERLQQERGLSDETIDAAYDLIQQIASDALVGKFSAETVDMALKAMSHDADVDNAHSEGVIAGRNANIEEKLRRPQQGDGMPASGGANAAIPTKKRKGIFDDLPQRKF